VYVQHAQLVFIKTTKVKQHASNVHWGKGMSMLNPLAGVVV